MPIDSAKLAKMLAEAKSTAQTAPSSPDAVELSPSVSSKPIIATPESLSVAPPSVESSTVSVANQAAVNPAEISYPGLFELSEKILALDKAIQANHPSFESLLQQIHRNLDKDPQLMHMLKEEHIPIIFAGLKKKTQTKIVEDTVRSAGSGRGKGLKNIGLDDL